MYVSRLFYILIFFLIYNLTYPQWNSVYTPPYGNQAFAKSVVTDPAGNIYAGGFWWSGENTEDNFILIKYNEFGDTIWTRDYNGPTSGQDRINCLTVDSQGNIIAAGESESNLHYDFFTIKFNQQGNIIWSNRFNWVSNSYDYPSVAAVDNLSNIYIAGKSTYGSIHMIIVIKYSSSGSLLWAKNYMGDSTGENYPSSIAINKASGNIYITGFITSSGGNKNIITLKYSPNGELLWNKRYAGSSSYDNAGMGIGIDALQNSYIAGYVYNDSINADFVTIKYNTAGNMLWTRYFSGSAGGADIPVSIKVDSIGNNFVSGSSFAGSNGVKYVTIKYDSAGTVKWQSEFSIPGSIFNYPVQSALSSAGNILVAGKSSGINPSFNDYAVLKYNNISGQVTGYYRFHFSGYNNNEPTSLALDAFGNCILTGYITTDSSLSIGTLKVNENTIGIKSNIETTPTEFFMEQNFPNPFNPETNIKIHLKAGSHIILKIYDILGKEISILINKFLQAGSYTVRYNGIGLASGIYFYEMDAGGAKFFRKMVLVK